MKRLFVAVVLAASCLIVTSCNNTVNDSNPNTTTSVAATTVSQDATASTNSNEHEGVPSKKDIARYNVILETLNSDYSRSEDDILKEIAPDYGMTSSELKEYLEWVMPYATGIKD